MIARPSLVSMADPLNTEFTTLSDASEKTAADREMVISCRPDINIEKDFAEDLLDARLTANHHKVNAMAGTSGMAKCA